MLVLVDTISDEAGRKKFIIINILQKQNLSGKEDSSVSGIFELIEYRDNSISMGRMIGITGCYVLEPIAVRIY